MDIFPSFSLTWFIKLYQVYLLTIGVSSIEITNITGLFTIKEGSITDLECHWAVNISGESLYSVKWYQNLSEIYRYIPSHENPVKIFPNEHLIVDERESREGRVRLKDVSLGADGVFRCEVSAEGPAFFTAYGAINVTIVHPPKSSPDIIRKRINYEPGDVVDLTCEVSDTTPAPTLNFYINEEEAEKYVDAQRDSMQPNALFKSSRNLRLRLPDGGNWKYRIRCTAQVSNIYNKSSVLTITSPINTDKLVKSCAGVLHTTGTLLLILTYLTTILHNMFKA